MEKYGKLPKDQHFTAQGYEMCVFLQGCNSNCLSVAVLLYNDVDQTKHRELVPSSACITVLMLSYGMKTKVKMKILRGDRGLK